MSHRNWKDTLIGFVFYNWEAIDRHLTGKDTFSGDSGAVERYAEALGLNLTLVGSAAVFSLSDTRIPWIKLDNGLMDNGEGKSVYLEFEDLNRDDLRRQLNALKETLEATGLTPDVGPVLVHVDEWG